jgi:membrane dipeptidase
MTDPSIDLHVDTLMAIVHEGHRLEARGAAPTQVDVPRMRQGRLNAAVFAIFVSPYWEGEAAAARAHQLIDKLDSELARAGVAGLIGRAVTTDDVMRLVSEGRCAALIGIEGGHTLADSLEHLREFASRGVRYISLTWANAHGWADSSGSPAVHGGLTSFGRHVVREMERLGVLVDVSHVADSTFWDVIDCASAPIIASHSSCRALCNHPRDLSDEQLRAIAQTGGVAGINFHSVFLDDTLPGGAPFRAPWRDGGPFSDPLGAEVADRRARPSQRPGVASLDRLVGHVVHALEVAGPDHVALGSDFDGLIVPPAGLEDVGRLPVLRAALGAEGVSTEVLDAIWGGNAMRVLRYADQRRADAGV